MLSIIQADGCAHRAVIHDLFWEYLHWVCAAIHDEYGISFDDQSFHEKDMSQLQLFMPPEGRLLLAYVGSEPAGCVSVRTNRPDVAEIKRMYVRPTYRNQGIGRALVDQAIAEVRASGYATLRLDSARFMTGAHALYRSAGFKEIPPYPESEIPEEFRVHWIFMELLLNNIFPTK